MNADVGFFFKAFEMRSQVAVGDLQQVLERIEIVAAVCREYTHDLEPDPVLKCFIEIVQRIGHLSYLKYMNTPYTICIRPNPTAQKRRPSMGQ